MCIVNFGDTPATLPAGEVMISSIDLVTEWLPADATAWIRPA